MGRKKGSKNKKIIKEIKDNIERKELVDNVKLSKEDEEKQNKLKELMRDINKNIDGANVVFASDVEERERLTWGYKVLDDFTGGGIVRGVFTTVWGSKGTSKTSLAYKMIAENQKQGKIVAYINVERGFDKVYAVKMGVNLNELVLVETELAEQALDAFIQLVKKNVIDLIIIDSIHGLCPKGVKYKGKANKEKSTEDDTMALLARKLSQFFPMVIPHVADNKCAVLLIAQSRIDLGSFVKLETLTGGNALKHNSRLIIRVRRGSKSDAPTEKVETNKVNEKGKKIKETRIIGFNCVLKIEYAQVSDCKENQEISVPFIFGKGLKED